MKRASVILCAMLAAASWSVAEASSKTSVHWHDIVGVITAQGVNNPVSANVSSGTFAWSTSGGKARVDLATGDASFEVDGLVINGTMFSGTPGPVTQVVGTLVCNPGDATQELALDTAPVALNAQGDARFSGPIHSIPTVCANPLFLVRIAVPAGAAGLWIATGAERTLGSALQ